MPVCIMMQNGIMTSNRSIRIIRWGCCVDNMSNTFRQNNLPGNFNTSNRNSRAATNSITGCLLWTLPSKIDSTADLLLRFLVQMVTAVMTAKGNTTTLRGNGTLLNDNKINNSSNNNYENVAATHQLRKAFFKKERKKYFGQYPYLL